MFMRRLRRYFLVRRPAPAYVIQAVLRIRRDSISDPTKSPVKPGFKPPIVVRNEHQEWLLRRSRSEYAGILILAEGFGFSWPVYFECENRLTYQLMRRHPNRFSHKTFGRTFDTGTAGFQRWAGQPARQILCAAIYELWSSGNTGKRLRAKCSLWIVYCRVIPESSVRRVQVSLYPRTILSKASEADRFVEICK